MNNVSVTNGLTYHGNGECAGQIGSIRPSADDDIGVIAVDQTPIIHLARSNRIVKREMSSV